MSNTPKHPALLTCDEMLTLGMPVHELLEDLEDDLGPEAVWKLTGHYGGTSIHLAETERARRNSVAAEQVGAEILDWLFARYGHGSLRIPLGPHSRAARILATARAENLKGRSNTQVAKTLGCCARTAERARARLVQAGFL